MLTSQLALIVPTTVLLLIKLSLGMAITEQKSMGISTSPETAIERLYPVPGRNAASFTDGGWENQLCETFECDVSPKLPVVDEQILLYLWFSVPNVEGLDKAILHVKEDSPKSHTYELPLAETPFLRIRRHNQLWTPKNVLTPGWNELFADYRFLSIATTTGNYNFEFRVKLPEPDGRLLFGFNQTFFLKGW